MEKQPVVHVIAGANGAGKTTFAMRFLPKIAGCRNFVNADLIAAGLSPLNVDAVAMQAGKIFLKCIDEQIARRNDFAFETTLSGQRFVRLFKRLRDKGYRIHLYFLWMPTVSLAMKRIANRVRMGGHSVPSDVVRRRYGKGLENLFKIYAEEFKYCAIFDNSSTKPALVCEYVAGKEHIVRPKIYGEIRNQLEKKR